MKRSLQFALVLGVLASASFVRAAPPTREQIRELLDAGKLSEAEAEARELLKTARSREGARSVSAAKAMDLVVEARDKAGKADSVETLTLARNAVSIKESILGREHPELATSLEWLAITLQLLDRTPEAQTQFERALHIREHAKPPDPAALAACLQRMAALKMQIGDYAAARALFERLEPILDRGQGPKGVVLAGMYYSMGQCLYRLGDFVKAEVCYERSRSIVLREYGAAHPLNGWISNSMGNLHDDTGDFDLARSDYEEALRIANLIGRKDFKSSCLNNLGALYRDFGDYAAAETAFARALEIEKEIYGPRTAEVARTTYNLARLYYLAGEFNKALTLADTTLSIRTRVLGADHNETGDSLWLLGLCKLDLGDPGGAVPALERAKTIFETNFGPKHWDVSLAVYGLAQAFERTGKQERALALYGEALELRRASLGPDHPLIGEVSSDYATLLAKSGLRDEAFDLALGAARVVDQHVEAMIATFPERQAIAYSGISKRSLDVALSMLDATSSSATIDKCWDALIHSRALVIEEMARRNRSLGDSNDPEVARLEDERRAASRRLAHLLVQGPAYEETPGSYRPELDEARKELEETERRLAAKSRVFRESRAGTQVELKDVKKGLPKSGALVAYVLYRDALRDDTADRPTANRPAVANSSGTPSYLAFVLRPGKPPKCVDLGRAAVVDSLVLKLRRESAAPASLEAYLEVGKKVRERVWDVVTPYLAGVDQVFLVPDGTLSLLNFYGLPVSSDQFLVEQGPLLQQLVAERDLVALGKEATLGRGLLAIGGPDFEQAGDALASAERAPVMIVPRLHRGKSSNCEALEAIRFDPLPASKDEARTVASLWRNRSFESTRSTAENVLLLEGSKATEGAFKSSAPGRRTLHVATHGFFLGGECENGKAGARGISGHSPKREQGSESLFNAEPLYLSGLVLAGANRRGDIGSEDEDGILTAEEISALDLQGVEWGVLSACESGVGTFEAREGIRGLRCAFQAAGVRTLIMSLWGVDDEATRDWMTSLYSAHFNKKLSTAASIREASRQVLLSRRGKGMDAHPFFWAGFVGTGDWR